MTRGWQIYRLLHFHLYFCLQITGMTGRYCFLKWYENEFYKLDRNSYPVSKLFQHWSTQHWWFFLYYPQWRISVADPNGNHEIYENTLFNRLWNRMPSGQAEQVIVPGTSADLRLRGIQLRQVSLPLDFLCLLINL